MTHPVEIGFLAMLGALAAHQLADPDLWTHLAAGRWWLTTGQILQTNQFSFAYPDHPWLNVYWLYQLVLIGLWHLGGAPALVAFKVGLAMLLGALVLAGLRDHRAPLTGGEAITLFLGGLLLLPRLTDRPEVISYICLAGLLAALQHRRWWICFLLQLLWANTHGFFYLGPVVVGLYAIGAASQRDRPRARAAALAATGLVAVSAMSPLGWRNLLGLGEARGTLAALGGVIEETISPWHPRLWMTDANVLVLLLFLALILVVFVWRRRELTVFDWMLVVLTLPVALFVRRSVPLLVIGAWPVLLRAGRSLPAPRLQWATAALMVLLALDFVSGGGRLIRFSENPRTFGFGVREAAWPRAAVEYLRADATEPVRLLNIEFHTGGYLTWALGAPGHVLIDGRMEAYPRSFVLDYLEAQTDLDRLAALARQYQVTHLLIVTDTPASQRLLRQVRTDQRWSECQTDSTAAVFQPAAAALTDHATATR